jgi:hypothetical protein
VRERGVAPAHMRPHLLGPRCRARRDSAVSAVTSRTRWPSPHGRPRHPFLPVEQQLIQISRPRQAAYVRGEDPLDAGIHVKPLARTEWLVATPRILPCCPSG